MGRLALTDRRALIGTTVIGFCLRLGWWAYARPAPVSDFEYYRRAGLQILTHGQLGFPRPTATRVPGHPALMAVLQSVGQSVEWLSVAMVVLSTLLVPLVYWLALALTQKPRAAFWAALLCAVNPAFVFLAPVLASEHLYALLLVTSLACLVPAPGASSLPAGRAVAAGLLFGAATLTRVDALFYLPVAGALALGRPGRLAPRLKLAAVVVGCAALVVAPWCVRNRIVIGPGIGLSSLGGLTFYYGHNDRRIGWHDLDDTPLAGLTEAERQKRGYELGLAYIRQASFSRLLGDVRHATYVLYWSLDAASLHWSSRAVGPTPDEPLEQPLPGIRWLRAYEASGYHALAVLALASLFVFRRYPLRFWCVSVGVVALTWVGDAVIMNAATRHRYVVEAIFCMMAGALLSEVTHGATSVRVAHESGRHVTS